MTSSALSLARDRLKVTPTVHGACSGTGDASVSDAHDAFDVLLSWSCALTRYPPRAAEPEIDVGDSDIGRQVAEGAEPGERVGVASRVECRVAIPLRTSFVGVTPFGGFTVEAAPEVLVRGAELGKIEVAGLARLEPAPGIDEVFLPITTSCWSNVSFPSEAVTVQSWLAGATNMPVLDSVSDDPSALVDPVATTSTSKANAAERGDRRGGLRRRSGGRRRGEHCEHDGSRSSHSPTYPHVHPSAFRIRLASISAGHFGYRLAIRRLIRQNSCFMRFTTFTLVVT